ncbi:MAG TPA: acyclic terpene utilization AtuA family protein [Acidimicrobiales bacterium]|nr:acyclic terpene utilization AtuA family protein [Acidimicrobiales bacterium]
MTTIRLGGGQGFYGDGVDPVADVLDAGVDYLVCEALAELTLAILQKDRQRDERLGYTRDLPQYIRSALPFVVDGRTKFITNAGGINPVAAGRAVIGTLKAAGVGGVTVATVVGDDVRPLADQLGLADDALFASVYLGARPIVDALAQGAQIVVTGRVADASLFLAPLVYEHGWAWDDWDRLAAGVVVGHLLECSGQIAGGNYSGPWWENPDLLRIGFPIAGCEADGTAVITKPAAAGGMITFDTVREQLLYEVHDPSRYLNPDVTADFTSLTLDDLGSDRVRVSGTRGTPAPATYKGLVCTPAGWAGEATFAYSWPDAEAKARVATGWLRARAQAAGLPVEEWCEEYFGAGIYHGPAYAQDKAEAEASGWEPPEVLGRLAWRTADPESAAAVGRGAGVLGLSGPPMISGFGRARGGKPTQLLGLEAIAVDRALVDAQVRIDLAVS